LRSGVSRMTDKVVSSTQETMVSLKPHAQVHLLSPVDKCKVCGEPAAKHIHYGAMSCFSCRAFFRRSIQNKTANTYVCRRNKDCQINLKTRKNCQYCRYERCLGVGMKPSWVLSPDERERRFRKTKEKKETKLESVMDSCDSSSPPTKYEPCTTAVAYSNNIKQELTTSLLGVKSEIVLYAGTDYNGSGNHLSVAGHGSPPNSVAINGSPPNSVGVNGSPLHGVTGHGSLPRGLGSHGMQGSPPPHGTHASPPVKGCVEGPTPPDRMYGKEMLPRTSHGLISTVQHQNLYVYSPTSQHLAATTPVISAREDVTRAIVVTCGEQLSASSSPRYSALPSRLSIASPQSVSPPVFPRSVIVKSQYLGDPPTHHPTNLSQSFSARQTPDPPVAPWHTPVPATDSQPSCSSSTTQRLSPFLAVGGRTPPPQVTGMSEESEYEDSVYSRSSDDERSIQGFLSEPEIKFTEEEHENLRCLVRSHDEKYRSVNFGEELIKEMIMCSMFGIPISTSAAISGYRLTVERITRIANHLDCFADLPMMDQSSLLKENADLLVSLRGAIFFDSKKKGVNQVLISMGIDDLETIKTMFSPLMKESRMKHIDYKIFNSIQKVESNNSVEQRYNFLQGKVAESISDDIITILLTYIILFSVDFCSLQDSRHVEQLQEQFIRMLVRYVYSKTNRQDACNTLANVLNAVTCIREMADIKKMRAINTAVKIN